MSAYKDSGIKWLGKIPTHWEVVKLGFLFNFGMGETILASDLCNNGYDVYSATEHDNPFGKFTNPHVVLQPDDFVIPARGNCIGAVKYIQKPSTCTQTTMFAKTKGLSNSRFVYHILKNFRCEIFQFTNTAIPQFTIADAKEILIPLPPLKEQRKIADFLDEKCKKIDDFIAKQTKFIKLLKEQKQVLINQTTTKGLDKSAKLKDSHIPHLGKIPTHWEVVRLKNIAKFNRGLNITKENLKDDGVYCISYGEIHSKYPFIVNPKNHKLKCVENEYLNTNINSMLYKGDFIFADTSEDIEGSGNFTLYDGEDEAFAGYHTIIARVDKNIFYPKFLAYEFDSKTYRNKIQSLVSGVKVFSITQAILRETEVWIPPLKEQEKIAKYLDDKCSKIDKAVSNITKQIKLMREYKSSLINTTTKGLNKSSLINTTTKGLLKEKNENN